MDQRVDFDARLSVLESMSDILLAVFDYDDSNVTATTVPEFKRALRDAYSRDRHHPTMGSLVFCQMLGMYLPSSVVISGHLWKRAWARCAHTMPVCICQVIITLTISALELCGAVCSILLQVVCGSETQA